MKLARLLSIASRSKVLVSAKRSSLIQAGFTMIELLVVIAVIGVLAVAVLSSINPIEQINKGRDTRTRSDAAQLINAIDRYYSIHEEYPWNVDRAASTGVAAYDAAASLENSPNAEYTQNNIDAEGETTATADSWAWIYHLTDTAEVKEGFVNRVVGDNKVIIFKNAGYNKTMYACFLPTSQAFKLEAMNNCADGVTPGGTGSIETPPAGMTTCPDETDLDAFNLICLP